MDRALKGYAVLTTIGMLVIVIMGAIVTNTGSQNGCGASWPLCYGKVIPDAANHETWIEYSHRVVSAFLGVMVVALAIWSWIRLPCVRETKWLAILSVLFIALQGALGGAAVIWPQSSFALALHFGFSIIAFSAVLLLTVVIFEQLQYGGAHVPKLSRAFKSNIYGLTIYTYIVVYSGAFVRHSSSGMGCGTSWPLCQGQLIPDIATPAGVQFIHRLAAAVVFLWTLALLIKVLRGYREERAVRWATGIAFLLVVLQVLAGAFVVWTSMSLVLLLLHAFFITCFFGILCYLFMIASRIKK